MVCVVMLDVEPPLAQLCTDALYAECIRFCLDASYGYASACVCRILIMIMYARARTAELRRCALSWGVFGRIIKRQSNGKRARFPLFPCEAWVRVFCVV